jgi:hypothetical protein
MQPTGGFENFFKVFKCNEIPQEVKTGTTNIRKDSLKCPL